MEERREKMEIDPSPSLQDIYKTTVQRYFFQLTRGCGRQGCTNVYCASGPNKALDPNKAAALSLKLALSDSNLCPSTSGPIQNQATPPVAKVDPSTPHLTVEGMKQLIATAKSTNEYTPVIRVLGSIFSTPEYLNLSFLRGDLDTPANAYGSGLDFSALDEFYAELQVMPENVVGVLASAFGRLVASMRRTASSLIKPESLRQILIVLQSPMVNETSLHREIMSPLCLAVVSLPEASKNLLIKWWTEFGKERFQQVLGTFRQYITMRLVLPPPIPLLNSDEYIVAATKIVGMLHEANERANFVSYIEFYNEIIDEQYDIKEDFFAWKNKSGFSFCNYPFILHPSTKSKVLQFESIVQQQLERQAALQRTLMSGNLTLPSLVFKIRRLNLIEDTLTEISRHDPEDLKKELRVHFMGEEALDEGGVQKEFFQLIVREIFDPKYGMFTYNNETRTYWFNSSSMDFGEFELIGIILGLAIYNSVILDIHFPFVVYKKLMNVAPALEDLKDINPGLLRGLKKLLEFDGDVESAFCQYFQITYEAFGEICTHDLKPGGDKIPLTNENRQEYVDLYTEYLLVSSVQKQFDAFMKGFTTVCMSPAFKLFRVEELELLICGSPVLDFEELEKVTIYDNGFTKNHPLIRNFWSIVHAFTPEQKRKLLFFSTGSDRAPIGGLGKLSFVITRHGPDSDRLPIAHTCFNHLLLPEYSTREKLEACLLTAISNAEGFGMI